VRTFFILFVNVITWESLLFLQMMQESFKSIDIANDDNGGGECVIEVHWDF